MNTPWLQLHRSFALQQVPLTESEFQHQLFGPSGLQHADCPNCQRPFTHFARIDTADPRLSLPSALGAFCHALYCWRCGLSADELHYRVRSGSLELLQYEQCWMPEGFPYEDYPEYFPSAGVRLRAVADEERAAAIRWNEGNLVDERAIPGLLDSHVIGGEFAVVGDLPDSSPSCRSCGSEMELFLRIGNSCTDPRGLHGNDFVQVLYWCCGDCGTLCARHVVE